MPLTVAAPTGAHFEMEEVKTAKGQTSLGEVPILIWDDVDALEAHITKEGIINMADGTSLRVSYQSIARRGRAIKAKDGSTQTDDQIAQAQVDFKPGKRVGGVSTPKSRAKSAAGAAAEKVDGDLVSALLKKIADGELSEADLEALTGQKAAPKAAA